MQIKGWTQKSAARFKTICQHIKVSTETISDFLLTISIVSVFFGNIFDRKSNNTPTIIYMKSSDISRHKSLTKMETAQICYTIEYVCRAWAQKKGAENSNRLLR